VSIGHDGDGEHGDFSDFFPWPTNWQSSARPVRRDLIYTFKLAHKEFRMIEPPTQQPGNPERKIELSQTVDYAVQLLVEEAHLVGWQRVEFLTAVMDAANGQLSAIEEERELEVVPPVTSS